MLIYIAHFLLRMFGILLRKRIAFFIVVSWYSTKTYAYCLILPPFNVIVLLWAFPSQLCSFSQTKTEHLFTSFNESYCMVNVLWSVFWLEGAFDVLFGRTL